MSTFLCPLCKTSGRWGTGTRDDGGKFYHCNGTYHETLPGGGAIERSCNFQCEPHQALEFGITTIKEELLQVAHIGSTLSTELGARAHGQPELTSDYLGDAAERFEKLADRLRIVRSYVIERGDANGR